ncbi:MAG: BTAD domain-containing putative transcriptional regulator, partial [Chloroflexota bacterium]
MTTQRLTLQLFGPPKIQYQTVSLINTLSTKATALLIYLAVTGRVHTRDEIATVLWSEMPNTKARNNLRRVLPDLRKQLHDYFIITRDTVAFNQAAPYDMDIDLFSACLEPITLSSVNNGSNVGLLEQTPQSIMSPHKLTDALQLYRGNFLAGFQVANAPVFEEWVRSQQTHWRGFAITGWEYLLYNSIQQGDIQTGLAASGQLLALEPWHEAAHRHKMRLLAQSGQRAAALSQYATCYAALADEFGAEPSPETVALYEQIKRGQIQPVQMPPMQMQSVQTPQPIQTPRTAQHQQPNLWQENQHALQQLPPSKPNPNRPNISGKSTLNTSSPHLPISPSPPLPISPSPCQTDWGEIPRATDFYGRDEERRQLKQWILDERCSLVTIVGVGGTGKTALSAAIAREVAAMTSATVNRVSNTLAHDTTQVGFSYVIWRSLVNAPPLATLLPKWLAFLTSAHDGQGFPTHALSMPDIQSKSIAEQATLLLEIFRQHRCLLILDNMESILQAEGEAGIFRAGYEDYELLLQQVGETTHQSCVLATSREQPVKVARLVRDYPHVRSLFLSGLPVASGVQVLAPSLLYMRIMFIVLLFLLMVLRLLL